MLSNCTATQSILCWPCDAGFACDGSEVATPCVDGKEWSARGAGKCLLCSRMCPSSGMMRVLSCASTSDRVCAACPDGYGCVDDEATPCAMNTHSDGNGSCTPCPANTSSLAGATECTASACAPNEFMTAERGCQACPDGFECSAQGVAAPCRENWYSESSKCVECDPHAESPERSSSANQCICVPGYVKTANHKCVPCQSGTVWRSDGTCVLCEAGHYCVGRTHRDVCPADTYSTRGSAQCADCRPFSGCATPLCTEASNCTCDAGYIDFKGACLRCAPGTFEANNVCAPCAPGFECLGGADLHECGLGTFSNGSASRCSDCMDCRELLVARCNQTHDSTCARTTVPLAVVTILQYFRTEVDGEIFTMFAMILASTLPKARLMHICGGTTCIECFQGVCPVQRMKRQLNGPLYRTAIESRFHANKLFQNVESLLQSTFLAETAQATMRKLTDVPFIAESRVEHVVICPEALVWDPRMAVCYRPSDAQGGSPRTWLGLVLGVSILAGVAIYGGRNKIRSRMGWVRVQEEEGGSN
jgi:hypothetical protein